jgi:hypothetical protein
LGTMRSKHADIRHNDDVQRLLFVICTHSFGPAFSKFRHFEAASRAFLASSISISKHSAGGLKLTIPYTTLQGEYLSNHFIYEMYFMLFEAVSLPLVIPFPSNPKGIISHHTCMQCELNLLGHDA